MPQIQTLRRATTTTIHEIADEVLSLLSFQSTGKTETIGEPHPLFAFFGSLLWRARSVACLLRTTARHAPPPEPFRGGGRGALLAAARIGDGGLRKAKYLRHGGEAVRHGFAPDQKWRGKMGVPHMRPLDVQHCL